MNMTLQVILWMLGGILLVTMLMRRRKRKASY
jgi:hypothetical protein